MLSFARRERADTAGVKSFQTEGFLEATMNLIYESYIVQDIDYSEPTELFPTEAQSRVLTHLREEPLKHSAHIWKMHMVSAIPKIVAQ